jgi:hypothetical protein
MKEYYNVLANEDIDDEDITYGIRDEYMYLVGYYGKYDTLHSLTIETSDGESLALGTVRRIIQELEENNHNQDFLVSQRIVNELQRKYIECGIVYFLIYFFPSDDFFEFQVELLRNGYFPLYPPFQQAILILMKSTDVDDLIKMAIGSGSFFHRKFYAYAMGFFRRVDVISKCIDIRPTRDMMSFIYDAVVGALDAGAEKEAMDICSMLSRLPVDEKGLKLTKEITKSPTVFKYLVEHKYTSPFFAFKAALLSNNVELVNWILPHLSEKEVVMAYKLAYIRGDIDIADVLRSM